MRRTRERKLIQCGEGSYILAKRGISGEKQSSNSLETVKILAKETAQFIQHNRRNTTGTTVFMETKKLKSEKCSCDSAARKMAPHRPQTYPSSQWCRRPSAVQWTTVVLLHVMLLTTPPAAATAQPPGDAYVSPGIQKRQIYRESLAPSLGGVIPAGALSRERLKHNAQDAVGIEAPDGLVYQPRETDVRPGARDPEDINEILTLTKQLHPSEPTDYNGMIPPAAQKTTYLLRRPHKFSRNISPSIFHPDAPQTSPNNYLVADIPRPPHYKELLPNPGQFSPPFPFQTGYSNPPPPNYNSLGSVLRFYSNSHSSPHFEGIYAPKFSPAVHIGGHLQNVRSYSQHSIIVI